MVVVERRVRGGLALIGRGARSAGLRGGVRGVGGLRRRFRAGGAGRLGEALGGLGSPWASAAPEAAPEAASGAS
ncbi:hypothetical protein SHKM778_83710 [Streptomyces sp. KM77-8]|uniref:Uncharacterized protein n=1 Tax=Streptomyces haneummycinicus TaxID=3074435 RepID=A0AAT9HWU5_9ACTN